MDVDLDFELSVDNAIQTAQTKGKALQNRELIDNPSSITIHEETLETVKNLRTHHSGNSDISKSQIMRPAMVKGSQIFHKAYWGVVEEFDRLLDTTRMNYRNDDKTRVIEKHDNRDQALSLIDNKNWVNQMPQSKTKQHSIRYYKNTRKVAGGIAEKMELEGANNVYRCFLNLGLSQSKYLSDVESQKCMDRAKKIIEVWEARRDKLKIHANAMMLMNSSSVSREDLAEMSLEQKSEEEIRQIMEENLDEN